MEKGDRSFEFSLLEYGTDNTVNRQFVEAGKGERDY
jgi:hypothetical protein